MDQLTVMKALDQHVGANNGISGRQLVMELTDTTTPSPGNERELREIIKSLREQGVRICGYPGSGYYLAATADELNQTCSFLRSRAMSSLVQEARLRNIALPELIGQLNLQLAPPAESQD